MTIFSQKDFLGGLNLRSEATKLPQGAYRLLINGRVTNNTIRSTKAHKKIYTPSGKKQGFYGFGKYLLLFVDGKAYWANTDNLSWTLISNWTQMSATADRIYCELIPVSYFQGGIKYNEDEISNAVIRSIPGISSPTPQQLFVTDGINQPQVISASGVARVTNGSTANWSPENPEYVPLGVLPKRSGPKLYLVDTATRTKIYQSVSGRFLDFVINRNPDGGFGGDEQTTFKSVDFNPITSLYALPGDGLFVGTLYSSYAVYPDYTTEIFAEPMLREELLFPTGPLNERTFADINGDIGFITQAGIQSFNITRQKQAESNNFPLGSPISELLIQPQKSVAAVNYDTYALFSVDTIYGNGVLVYDNTLNAFVSLDLNFGEVIDFVVLKTSGVRRLFFLDSYGDVYEAFAGDKYSVCKVYLGESSTIEGSIKHRPRYVSLQFNNISENTDVQLTVYQDGSRTFSRTQQLDKSSQFQFVPRVSNARELTFNLGSLPYSTKSGYFIEWGTSAELVSAIVDGDTLERMSFQGVVESKETDLVLTFFTGNDFGAAVTALTPGQYYVILGTITFSDGSSFTDRVFKAPDKSISSVTGTIYPAGDVKTIWDLMMLENPAYVIGAGDHAMSSGDEWEVKRILTIVDKSKVLWAPGNHDIDTLNGRYFFQSIPTELFYKRSFGNICDIFFLHSGFNTAGNVIVDNTYDSTQGIWFRREIAESTAKFKFVVFHHPPYTFDTEYSPGFTELRWPFDKLGVDLVINGHANVYQRMLVGIPYVVLGPSGSAVRAVNGQPLAQNMLPGFLKIKFDYFNAYCEWVGKDGEVYDSFSLIKV